MMEILPESGGDLLGMRFTGRLTEKEYSDNVAPAMEKVFAEHGAARVLCYFDEGFEGWEAGAMWDDTKFGLRHRKDFARLAIVGGERWLELLMKLFAPIVQGEVATFPADRLEDAWKWLRA